MTAPLVDRKIRKGPARECGAPARAGRLHPFTLLAIVTMLVVVGLTVRSTQDRGPETAQSIRVNSSGTVFTTLDQLVDASDVVVIGRAVSVSPGRLFAGGATGDGGDGVVSQIAMIEVGAVLAGPDPGTALALEEEAGTTDGRSLVVDGLRPTRVGDQGIFFLVRGDPELAYFVTVATVGRFLRASDNAGDDRLLGVDGEQGDLATALAHMGGRALTKAVEDRALQTGRAGS